MMLIVGLIGGIGSGKTTVSDRFAQLGVTIADDVLVNNGNLEQLMFEVGKLHRQYLSLSKIPLQENNQVNTQ